MVVEVERGGDHFKDTVCVCMCVVCIYIIRPNKSTNTYIRMYSIRIYVCTYICLYVCMYICILYIERTWGPLSLVCTRYMMRH